MSADKPLPRGRVLLAIAGAAVFKIACAAPYPPGNLIAPPPCPDGGPNPCQETPDAGNADGGVGGDK